MGRYRAPQAPPSPYMTSTGYQRLVAELEDLWRHTRPQVTQALAAAAAEGDRSENAEYIYRKKQLAAIDRRIRYLNKRLEAAKVVRSKPNDRQAVFFGARVGLRCEDGTIVRYRIVGVDEIDPALGAISIDSPVAKALLKKRIGEHFEVELPNGVAGFRVLDIDYDD